METFRVTFALSSRIVAGLTCLGLVAGCSSVENLLAGDKVDYKSTSTSRTNSLEVPPDLSQLSRDSRYQQPNGTVSASAFQTATAAAAAATPTVAPIAPQSLGAFKIERLGNERWLSTTLPPEAVYPQVKAFIADHAATATLPAAKPIAKPVATPIATPTEAKKSPARSAPAKNAPLKGAATRTAPAKPAPVKSVASKQPVAKKALAKKALAKPRASKTVVATKAAAKKTASKKTASKKTASKKAASKK